MLPGVTPLPPEVERPLRETEELQLVTRGRRTGRPHSVTLWFAYEDGALWLRTDQRPDGRGPDWYKNLLREPRCRVRIGGHELEGVLEPTVDRDAALRHLVDLWRAKYGPMWVSDWYVERGRLAVKVRLRGDG